MALSSWRAVWAAGLILGLPLAAQQVEPTSLGLQVSGAVPLGDLRTAVGSTIRPGFGGAIVVEQDYLDGLRGRLLMGGEFWPEASLRDQDGVLGGVHDLHLAVEGVMLLRTDADAPLLGPYVVAGLGLYNWSVSAKDSLNHSQTTRTTNHMAATFGFGWRITKHQDVELKGLLGAVDPGFTAMALTASITFRY